MPQVHKGERRVTTFRPDPGLKDRLTAAAKAHGFRHLDNYLVALLNELHPDPETEPDKARPAVNLLSALLGTTPLAQEELELSSGAKSRAA